MNSCACRHVYAKNNRRDPLGVTAVGEDIDGKLYLVCRIHPDRQGKPYAAGCGETVARGAEGGEEQIDGLQMGKLQIGGLIGRRCADARYTTVHGQRDLLITCIAVDEKSQLAVGQIGIGYLQREEALRPYPELQGSQAEGAGSLRH